MSTYILLICINYFICSITRSTANIDPIRTVGDILENVGDHNLSLAISLHRSAYNSNVLAHQEVKSVHTSRMFIAFIIY